MAARRVALAGTALGASVAVAVVGVPWYGQFYERHLIRKVGGTLYGDLCDLAEQRKSRRLPVVPDELLAEIHSIGRRLGMGLRNVKLILAPLGGVPATSGTLSVFGGHAYLILPGSVALDCMGPGAVKSFNALFPAPQDPRECDIEPNQRFLTLNPAGRYEIAHELAHIKREHSLQRLLTKALFASSLLSLPIIGMKWHVPPKLPTVISVIGIVPAFFAYMKLMQVQEYQADELAAQAGYAGGGLDFWTTQVSSGRVPDRRYRLWATHPHPEERLELMAQYCRRAAHGDGVPLGIAGWRWRRW